jgi:putative hydrolase of the HAD superfamily
VIKNIIFDLGGVLLDIDYNKTILAFTELGVDNFELMFSQLHADALFEKLETGKISENDFYKEIKKIIPAEVSDQTIEIAWNAMLLDFRKESLVFMESLVPRYRIFLLSNTNAIHLRSFKKIFTRDTGKPLLDSYFNKTWYSHQVGLRKPYKEIYEFALKNANLLANETLFIDDISANIEGAATVGINTHQLLPHERIENLGL